MLSNTIKSQLVNVKAFLEKNGVDTSYLNLSSLNAASETAATGDTPAASVQHNLPSAGTLASGGSAIVGQTLKLILGTISAVGNFFIVLFRPLFRGSAGVYRKGLLSMAPRQHRESVMVVVDRIGDTLERWLIAQMITMVAVFLVTWIGLEIIGIQSSFILGIQAGLLAFIPTVGALLGGLIVVLASWRRDGWRPQARSRCFSASMRWKAISSRL